MRPMVLRHIAETVEMHESTVSRVTNQKYMITPRGLYEFKYFFSSHVSTDSGGSASATAIRALLIKMTQAESARHPLSDAEIAKVLADQGIQIARRTWPSTARRLIFLPRASGGVCEGDIAARVFCRRRWRYTERGPRSGAGFKTVTSLGRRAPCKLLLPGNIWI
jgi:RNA polymerase, sigma 54 subunit, RpoN/SigL